MIEFRSFRNTDPPAIAAIWNECFTGRGAYPVPSVAFFERSVYSKPYFDRLGFIVATSEGVPVGFAHSGFGPNEVRTAIDRLQGVVCVVAVRPGFRRQSIGTELLKRSEAYLRQSGATQLQAGAAPPATPFYFGLYGGADLPGVLDSDSLAGKFFTKHGYRAADQHLAFQRRLSIPIQVTDPRMAEHRKRLNITIQQRSGLDNWWQESYVGLIEPVEFRLEDRVSKAPLGRAVLWEMDGFSHGWNTPSAGIISMVISPENRRKGLAKFFLGHLLRHLQEQCFGICECQFPSTDSVANGLLISLGFSQIDSGTVYLKTSSS